jgi:hypothetical protein
MQQHAHAGDRFYMAVQHAILKRNRQSAGAEAPG